MDGWNEGWGGEKRKTGVSEASFMSFRRWMAVPGRDLLLCTGSVGGTGWAARGSSDLGKNQHSPEPAWQSWLEASTAVACMAQWALCKAGKVGGLSLAGKEQWKGKETERMEPGKGKKQNCANMTGQENSYSNTNALGMSKIPWTT